MTSRPDKTWHRLLNWTSGQASSERLAAQILLAEGYTDLIPSHPLGGKDGGMDASCRKDDVAWIMAVYFPRGQKSFREIKKKFTADLAGVATNNAAGIVFVTNQELTLAERAKLAQCCKGIRCELYHLERINTILDQPAMAIAREQFLYIAADASGYPCAVLIDKHWSAVNLGYVKQGEIHAQNSVTMPSLHCPPFSKPQNNVGGLLKWSARIPQTLYGRENELATLNHWCTRSNPARDISVMVMHGVGGAGKTRLAFEFAESLAAQGWHVGQLSEPANPVGFVLPAQAAGVLLIIDYPEQHHHALQDLLKALAASAYPGCLRVLLLCRKHELAQLIEGIAPELLAPSLALSALQDQALAWAMFCDGFHIMQQATAASSSVAQSQPPLDADAFAKWLARDPYHAEPLIILAFALNLAYDPTAHTLGRAEIIQALVRRERARIARETAKHPPMQAEGTELLVALAALPGKLTLADVKVLRHAVQEDGLIVPDGMQLKRCSLWRDGALPELQPDLLAAELLHRVLGEHIADQKQIGELLWQCLALGGGFALRERLTRLARLAWDFARMTSGKTDLVLALIAALDAERAQQLADVLDSNIALESPLQGLAVAVDQILLAGLEALAREDFATHAPALARRLNNLSVSLAESGDRAGGLAASRRAVEILETLAQQNFVAYGPDLAMSLHNLSNSLAESGDRAGGLAAIRRAVEIYDALAQQNFAAYGPALAMSLNNLSVRLAESGDRAGGLAAIRRTVDIYDALAQQNFAAYGPDLARSLNNLSVHLAESGYRAGGLAAIRRAVEIYDPLAQQNFAAYGPALAMSLNNLSLRLAESGDRAGGLAAIQRAVEIREALAQQNFAAYGSYLAMSLNNLSNRLAESGDRAGGLAAIRRAVEIREVLAQQNHAAYAPHLANSLAVLANRLAEGDEHAAAITLLERAIPMIEPFVLPNTINQDRYDAMQAELRAYQTRATQSD